MCYYIKISIRKCFKKINQQNKVKENISYETYYILFINI